MLPLLNFPPSQFPPQQTPIENVWIIQVFKPTVPQLANPKSALLPATTFRSGSFSNILIAPIPSEVVIREPLHNATRSGLNITDTFGNENGKVTEEIFPENDVAPNSSVHTHI